MTTKASKSEQAVAEARARWESALTDITEARVVLADAEEAERVAYRAWLVARQAAADAVEAE